jgi:IS5 family transposase
VECISKGKAHKRYEFGVKASIAATSKSNFLAGGLTLPGNPFDGHTLVGASNEVIQDRPSKYCVPGIVPFY